MLARALPVCLVFVFACGPRPAAESPRPGAIDADAPYELADPDDFDVLRDRFRAEVPGPARAALRADLATELDRRARRFLARNERWLALKAFTDLVDLFRGRVGLEADGLSAHAPLAREILVLFAAAGGDIEAATALYALAAAEPDKAAAHLAEIEIILGYSDELATAEYGDGAEHSRPIVILEAAVAAVPTTAAVDRLARLYVDRKRLIDRLLQSGRLTPELIGAHGEGVVTTAWHVTRIRALAGDLGPAAVVVGELEGSGEDPELRLALLAALDGAGGEDQWIALARRFDSDDKRRDLAAARAVIEIGIARTPGSTRLRRFAAALAAKHGRIGLAIRLYEEGLAAGDDDKESASELAELYEFRVTRRALTGRPLGAAEALKTFESFYATAAARWPGFKPDLADAYAAMGRGLVSLGELGRARGFLDRSLVQRPTHEALEHLGLIALRRDRFAEAATYFERAIAMPAADPNVQFNHNKLLRLAGESRAGAGETRRGNDHFVAALGEWERMRASKTYELRPPFAADALVETGKLLWHLGKPDAALNAFAVAQDVAPDNANTYASVVAFLIVRDRYAEALDAYHRALGSREVTDYFKVYMSLWVMAEARRAGVEVDPFARDYLAERDGRLWYDDLARYASGRAALAPLVERANTRARRAELLYYRAVLGESATDPERATALLRDVVESDMVTFFEYEMAKHWLTRGFAR